MQKTRIVYRGTTSHVKFDIDGSFVIIKRNDVEITLAISDLQFILDAAQETKDNANSTTSIPSA